MGVPAGRDRRPLEVQMNLVRIPRPTTETHPKSRVARSLLGIPLVEWLVRSTEHCGSEESVSIDRPDSLQDRWELPPILDHDSIGSPHMVLFLLLWMRARSQTNLAIC
jgi:hypothetical protein